MDRWYFFKEILKGKSLSRALLAARLQTLFKEEAWLKQPFSVLELGSEPAAHQRTYPNQWRLTHSNYVPLPSTDVVLDVEKPLPLPDGAFDGVVFFGVLYLAENYENVLTEALRAARRFVLFNASLIACIAPHPTDFNRFPEERLRAMLGKCKAAGLLERYRVEPLGGSFSAAVSLIEPYTKFRIFRVPLFVLAAILDRLDAFVTRQCPIQYVVLVEK